MRAFPEANCALAEDSEIQATAKIDVHFAIDTAYRRGCVHTYIRTYIDTYRSHTDRQTDRQTDGHSD